MNLVLLLVFIAEVCLGLCVWLTPDASRWIAAHLLTRADVLEAGRKERSRRLQFWSRELGIDRDGDEFQEAVAIPTSMRR